MKEHTRRKKKERKKWKKKSSLIRRNIRSKNQSAAVQMVFVFVKWFVSQNNKPCLGRNKSKYCVLKGPLHQGSQMSMNAKPIFQMQFSLQDRNGSIVRRALARCGQLNAGQSTFFSVFRYFFLFTHQTGKKPDSVYICYVKVGYSRIHRISHFTVIYFVLNALTNNVV